MPRPASHHLSIAKMKFYSLFLYPGYFLSQSHHTFCHKQFPQNTAFIISCPAQECDCDSLLVTSQSVHTPLAWLPIPLRSVFDSSS